MTNIAIENGDFYWDNSLFLWPCSIAMLNYQRVDEYLDDFSMLFHLFGASGSVKTIIMSGFVTLILNHFHWEVCVFFFGFVQK